MAKVQEFKDRKGNAYGSVHQVGSRLEVRDKHGNHRGHYDPKTDRTTDQKGNLVGKGNLLATLVSPD